MSSREELPIRVNHPRRLPGWSLPAERIAMGKGYKPTMALLPDGSLVILTLYMKHGRPEDGNIPPSPWWQLDESLPPGKCREYSRLWRSADGGKTWTGGDEVEDMIAREQWLTCTSTGTLFATSHLLSFDVNNEDDVCTSWIHRSTDGGRTWQRQQALIEGDLRCGVPMVADKGTHTSRNVVELPDGTLLLGVSINSTAIAYVWKSSDNGVTWDKSQRAHLGGYYANINGFFCEDYTHLNTSGKLLHWCRMSPLDYKEGAARAQGQFPMGDDRVVPTGNDGINRMMMTTSSDDDRSWTPLANFGDYGEMYPRVTRLRDGRLLMTYTQRALFYPIGLRARLSYDDGETWDLDRDQIVIEGFTPWGAEQGGGFGNSVQLDDGTLVSCYSWNPGDNQYETEIVRWNLP